MRIVLERTDDSVQFSARDEQGCSIRLEGSESVGGHGEFMRPMHAVLSALAACSAIDVVSIIRKQRMVLEDIRVEVDAKRAEDATPAVFTDIDLHYILKGDLDRRKAESAVQLSQDKYCSVAAMLRPGVRITHRVTIEESTNAKG